jgi:hypothetical protein
LPLGPRRFPPNVSVNTDVQVSFLILTLIRVLETDQNKDGGKILLDVQSQQFSPIMLGEWE